jgi:Ca2+-binding RTX toxin-like protein
VQAGKSITLNAGDDLQLDGSVSAGERLFLAVDFHSADAAGGTATVGALVNGDRPELAGDDGNDTLDVSASSLAWTVDGRGGNDTITGGSAGDAGFGQEGATCHGVSIVRFCWRRGQHSGVTSLETAIGLSTSSNILRRGGIL